MPAELASSTRRARSWPAADRRSAGSTAWSTRPAITDRGSILDTSPELFDRMCAINVRAPFFLIQDAAEDHAPRADRGHDRQHPVDLGAWRPAFPRRLLRLEGCAGDAHPQCRLRADARRIRVNGLNIGWMDTPGEHATSERHHDAQADWLDKAGAGLPFGRLLDPTRGGARRGLSWRRAERA